MLLIVLLLIVMLCIILYIYHNSLKEQFTDIPIYQLFNDYIVFHSAFYDIWNKSIITSYGINQPSSSKSSTPPIPTNEQMNQFVKNLAIDKTFPPGANPLEQIKLVTDTIIDDPKKIQQYDEDLNTMMKYIPKDASIFINAYNWMNNGLEESHKSMDAALSGVQGFSDIEGFDSVANQLATCDELKKSEDGKSRVQNEKELIGRIQKILNDETLKKAIKLNKVLVDKSEQIKKDAQSGKLLGTFNTPPSSNIFVVPDAKLDKLKRDNPDQYNNYKQNYKQLFDIQSMNEQINATLH